MNKKIIAIISILIFAGTIGLCTAETNDEDKGNGLDQKTMYYPKATLQTAISAYKQANYTGCLQQTFSLVLKTPNNSAAYYYMALAYSNIGRADDAKTAFAKVMELSPNTALASYAKAGTECIDDPTACSGYSEGEVDDLDKFINAPYGNGLSPELDKELKQKKLNNFRNSINSQDNLKDTEMYKIRNFDELNKSEIEDNIKIAQVSDEEILNAVKTLKDAGLTITVSDSNAVNNNIYPNGYQDPEMAQLSLMLGNNNNNNSNMMNVVPFLMQSEKEGKNIDPQLMQAMMMNSMMTDFTFNTNDNNR